MMTIQDETIGPGTSQPEADSTSRSSWIARWPVVIWALLTVGLVAWVTVGSVSTTSYTYNQFLQMTFRNDRKTKIQEIWTYQADHLPDAGPSWLVEAAFDVSIALILVSVVAGCWLLLVRSTNETSTRRQVGRRIQDVDVT